MSMLVWLVVALQVADGLSTWYALRGSQRLSEGNPVVGWLMGRLGTNGALVASKAPLVAAVIYFGPTVHPYALVGLCLLYAGIVGNNLYRIWKNR